jgi:alcohol dehydrogenase class IV
LEINKKFIQESLNKICEDNKLTYEQLIEKIRHIPKGIIPYTLKEWGVRKNELNKLVEASFTKGRMDNNIKDLSTQDVRKILASIY